MPSSFPAGMPKPTKFPSDIAPARAKETYSLDTKAGRDERARLSSSGRFGQRVIDFRDRAEGAVRRDGLGIGSFSDKAIAGGVRTAARIGDSAFVQTGGMFGANAYKSLSAEAQERIGTSMYGISDSLTLFKNLSSASGSFMPSINDTMNRATRYYNATMYGGNQMSRKDVQGATYETMKGLNGITSAGSDANVAQYLAARGMAPQKGEGVYQQTIRTVANAARYMNISNEDAARSVEGLTNAKGSAETLRNFGIYTADLKTGKEKTQTQIFEELAGRLTAGRGKASVEQTQQSIRRGALGVTIDSFFQGDQQSGQMFKQYMIDTAAGKKFDLASKNRIETSGANKNPLESQMTIAAKQTGALGNAEDEYIAGIRTATGALGALTDVAGGLAKLMGGANALIQTLMGNEQFKGAVGGLTSIVDFSSKGLSGILTASRQASPLNPAGFVEAGMIAGSMGLTLGTAAGIGIGAEAISKIGTVQGTGAAIPSGGGGGMSGMSIGTAVLTKNTGASSDVANSFSMGDYSNAPGMSEPVATNNSGTLFNVDWLSGYAKTSEYGVNRGSYSHQGTDFGMPEGAEVKAVGDGTVTDTKTGITGKAAYGTNGDTGNMVRISHTSQDGKVYYSVYYHLSQVLVSKGQVVTQGQVIGRSGNTGNSTGPHLHLEFQDANRKGIPYADALKLIGGRSAQASGPLGISKETIEAGMKATKKAAQLPTQAVNAFNILKGLYSGDQSQILSSIGAMTPGLGISQDVLDQYLKAPDVSLVSSGVSAGATAGNAVNNNVSITVQVPDVTSADALKFAQLVRGYLQNDTLMSTTGSV